MLNLKE